MINNFHLKRYRILNDPREDEDKKFQDERKDQFIIEEKKLLKMGRPRVNLPYLPNTPGTETSTSKTSL